ncbi:MAG: soluble NSF attachment family protein [archaeon]|nr:soluble NSF attachment family protein [archaeon]
MQRENPRALIEKAQKTLKPGFFGKLFGSKSERVEQALELYETAANIYKMEKSWNEAGAAYEECAKLDTQLDAEMAANHYQEAAHCFSFTDKERQLKNLNLCISLYENRGKFQQAGKITQKIANDLEIDMEYEMAIDKYKKAADLFSMESMNTRSMQQQCLLKVADLMCISNHKNMLEEAPKIYETLGMQYLTVPLLKSSAKDVFFKCVVCYLAKKDEVSADIQLKKFLNEDPTMCDTRESKFLQSAIECITDPVNPEGFKKCVAEFKTYRDFDKWKINMFAEVLKNIEGDGEDLK